jgi:hypothetical protein
MLNQVNHNKRNMGTTKQEFLNWGKCSFLESNHCNISRSVQKLNQEPMLSNVADFNWRKAIWYGLDNIVVVHIGTFPKQDALFYCTDYKQDMLRYQSPYCIGSCILIVVVMILVVRPLARKVILCSNGILHILAIRGVRT